MRFGILPLNFSSTLTLLFSAACLQITNTSADWYNNIMTKPKQRRGKKGKTSSALHSRKGVYEGRWCLATEATSYLGMLVCTWENRMSNCTCSSYQLWSAGVPRIIHSVQIHPFKPQYIVMTYRRHHMKCTNMV